MSREDTFSYAISEQCVQCGQCAAKCPVHAITETKGKFTVQPDICIDCGTCSTVCPVGAIAPQPVVRESISLDQIDCDKCYFNAGCALNLYKPDVPQQMLSLLQRHFGNIKMHNTCCRHNPNVEDGATIINNCAGCDRRFRSLYDGVQTISFWEVMDSVPDLELPDYAGITVSVHDSCGYRHKPQVHVAVRNLLRKMHIKIVEADYHGTQSVCCGDNLYGYVPNAQVEERIKMRADQFPCDNVVVYCIGCVRAMESGGKRAYYLPDLLVGRETESMPDTLDEYHSRLGNYIEGH